MFNINWIIAILSNLIGRIINWRRSSVAFVEQNEEYKSNHNQGHIRSFDKDYHDATVSLRHRLNVKFPDGEYARLRSESGTPYGDGESRIRAVDQMSAAIASALRKGASVREAAEAGAATIGI